MKKIIVGLFLVASALSFAAGKVLRDEDVVFKEGLEKIYYENGKLKYELNYKNGTPYGNMKLYDETGNLVGEGPYFEVTTK